MTASMTASLQRRAVRRVPRYRLLRILLIALATCAGNAATAQDPASVTYRVTFTGNWTLDSTPDGVTGGAHFTTLIGAVHNGNVSFWRSGEMASAGIEVMAETGGTSTLRGEIVASDHVHAVIQRGSLLRRDGHSHVRYRGPRRPSPGHPDVDDRPEPGLVRGHFGTVACRRTERVAATGRGRPVSLRRRHRGGRRVLVEQPPHQPARRHHEAEGYRQVLERTDGTPYLRPADHAPTTGPRDRGVHHARRR